MQLEGIAGATTTSSGTQDIVLTTQSCQVVPHGAIGGVDDELNVFFRVRSRGDVPYTGRQSSRPTATPASTSS